MDNTRGKENPAVSTSAHIGDNTKIWLNVQIREDAKVGSGCNLGKDVYIDKQVSIGDRVKIQNGVSIYYGVTIEDDVFVGPHVAFTNDMYPRAFSEKWEVIPTVIKKGASLGANSTILCGVIIGEYAVVGAGSVVTEDVPPFTLVAGNPAKMIDRVCRCGRPLRKHNGCSNNNI